MTTKEMTPAEVIMTQIATIQDAIETLQAAVDDATGSIDPDEATWRDVSRLAHLVDAIKRAELV